MLYFIKTPNWIKRLFPKFVWNKTTTQKVIYLTFDDGPTPKITQWVLSELEKYQAKATFFCIGKNMESHPKMAQKIIAKGHRIGNHTQNHLNGWHTKTSVYVANVLEANQQISKFSNQLLFRPPYGKIKNSQAKALQKLGYEIVMWDVLSADFDTSISKEKCLNNVIETAKNGSIVVFHDSIKAHEKLKYVLPKVLVYFTKRGYVFKVL